MDEKPKYYNEARNIASQRYNAKHLEQVNFRVKKGEKAVLQYAATKHGCSMTQFIIQAINSYVGHQLLTPSDK